MELYNGKTLSEWSKLTGIKYCTLKYRVEHGWTIETAISMPLKTPSEASKKYDVIGKTFKDKVGNEFIVEGLKYRDKYDVAYYSCYFPESGYRTTAVASQIIGQSSHVLDRYSPTVHEVGILGDAHGSDNPKLYDVWRSMIARCYNPKNPSYKTYGAKGVTVCERWKRFDLFMKDIMDVVGFDQEKIDMGKLVLDKDIINRSAMTYSPETCCFVSRSENARESANRTWKERKV